MGRKRFYSLKQVKFRASWNKYNLYNLTRLRSINTSFFTFYQQKWKAKSMSRAYHGEQIREKQWQRMFTPKLNAVVPMDPKYLAEFDGSEQAAGRGSGLDKPLAFAAEIMSKRKRAIPYMHMTFAPIEKRLDMAIFRALFASSAKQARQFVTHGKVKVNGKKMPYPGYLLNPGDLFQVEPDSVLFATGAPKEPEQLRAGRKFRAKSTRVNVTMDKFRTARREKVAAQRAEQAAKDAAAEAAGETVKSKTRVVKPTLEDNMVLRRQRQADAVDLLKQAELLQNNRKRPLSAKQKQDLRALVKKVKVFQGQCMRLPLEKLEETRAEIAREWETAKSHPRQAAKWEAIKAKKASQPPKPIDPDAKPRITYGEKVSKQLEEERKTRMEKLKMEMHDPTKPYATPWRPRPFMSAFAFVPRYLEVNHKICSAVYLRDPVARPGLTEVPTPFPAEIQQLAFTWYLRRR
ncbi:related to NAM9-mitochondrial ribosomal protein, small subunit [Rhynchosporium agropyri]|uniref:Related to NAM9-mitochondrial ribosomal protein, small subunit n=2 Tax=Rhynchosporium TaxID=38037 RepID=A0A1E1KZT7_9HELO|nr:related to NAM9-mitochondrial ribosomal protein, small subunit [Rhynchosporium commune]CZT03750.1 related to NAM9-mitochondrial ribosomal protein, small subunit [Rhynchosporium agropyri]